MMSQVSDTRGNMYKLQNVFKYDIKENIFTEKLICGTL